MEKLVYLLRDGDARGNDGERIALVEACQTLNGGDVVNAVVNACDETVATAGKAVTIGTLEPPIWAMVSFWMENSDDRSAAEKVLRAHCAEMFGYLVVESVPTIPPEDAAKPNERSTGVNMVTCIKGLDSLAREDFFRIWYEDHKVVAQQTQSTFGYTRNTVVRPLVEGSPAWDGIVEELFPIEALSDPMVWYAAASAEELAANQQTMMASVQRFLDLSQLESHPMSRHSLG